VQRYAAVYDKALRSRNVLIDARRRRAGVGADA
jgi:hypothetical protein